MSFRVLGITPLYTASIKVLGGIVDSRGMHPMAQHTTDNRQNQTLQLTDSIDLVANSVKNIQEKQVNYKDLKKT